ncbi:MULTISPECIES: hypothetical protein [Capnocytophaga]|uniref:Uncharacterized protein n=2 Tax=Capnocytophaga TaxID=1016 RepID=A0ABW8Q9A4_9FLAO|nr:hypothetical protein [Capnocytophaga felis]GET46908.1 hypothetical protein RCZ01_22100 [Capnocytophaga felis]
MKEQYIKELENLDEKVLEKLVALSKSKKAKDYLTNPLLWVTVKKFFGI